LSRSSTTLDEQEVSSMCAVRTERRVEPGLAWGRLYGIVLMTVALGLVVDATSRAGAVHQLLAALLIIFGFGGMFLWVRSNRVALSVADTCDCAAAHLRIRVVASRPAALPRLGRSIETPALVEARDDGRRPRTTLIVKDGTAVGSS
jgi:hypothetical protein